MSYITAIGTANPGHRFSQNTIADFMLRHMRFNNGESRKLKAVFKASGIDYRYTVLEDYGRDGNFTFFSQVTNLMTFPSTEIRLQVFRKHAVGLSVAAVEKLIASREAFDIKEVTHLIVVCCTGMYAPGLDIDLVKHLGLRTTVQRTAINFMGCYAAFNALKAADAFCNSDRKNKVLIVCTELCSLHFQPNATDDNILANALFGDGSAAVLVEAETMATIKLKLESFHNDISQGSEQHMAWTIGDLGFEMKLSAYVPDVIRTGIAALTRSLLSKISKRLIDIRHFAIHPGGIKILQAIEQELGMTPGQNEKAYHVLRHYGNMSSPTVLFVLKEIMDSLTHKNTGDLILSFAFGPGLTLESMVLQVEKA
jgi:predicted naringenin-chalcone synthase